MQKVKLLISYDGTDFGGWQKQKSGKATVQGCIEKALKLLFKEDIKLTASGRTDAGVHAIAQVAHFKTTKDVKRYNVLRALNSLTPDSISIQKGWLVPADFHAIANCEEKTYKYLILNSQIPSALRARYATWIRREIDLDLLNSYCKPLLGEHDFSSFQSKGTEVSSTIRTITQAHWQLLDNNLIEFTITGNGFLKQMVRSIVGTQLDLMAQKAPQKQFKAIMAAFDRKMALTAAPALGLYLYSVKYPSSLDKRCLKI